jgi:hypothetical protein
VQLVTDISKADVIVLNGEIPNAEAVRAHVEQGAGLALILGPDLTASQVNALLGEKALLTFRENPLSLSVSNNSSDPIHKEIVCNWHKNQSAP